jgi:hypothetical protein
VIGVPVVLVTETFWVAAPGEKKLSEEGLTVSEELEGVPGFPGFAGGVTGFPLPCPT